MSPSHPTLPWPRGAGTPSSLRRGSEGADGAVTCLVSLAHVGDLKALPCGFQLEDLFSVCLVV